MSTNAKHTPIPWNCKPANDGLMAFRIAGNGIILADVLFKLTYEHAVSKEEAAANAAFICRAVNSHQELIEVLRFIAAWDHQAFPPTGKTWQDGSAMSYNAAYGSNGERDYMREMARAALSKATGESEGEKPKGGMADH